MQIFVVSCRILDKYYIRVRLVDVRPSLAEWHPGVVPCRVLLGVMVSAALAFEFVERLRDCRLLVDLEPCNELLTIRFGVRLKGYRHGKRLLELIRTLFGKIPILAWVVLDIE